MIIVKHPQTHQKHIFQRGITIISENSCQHRHLNIYGRMSEDVLLLFINGRMSEDVFIIIIYYMSTKVQVQGYWKE